MRSPSTTTGEYHYAPLLEKSLCSNKIPAQPKEIHKMIKKKKKESSGRLFEKPNAQGHLQRCSCNHVSNLGWGPGFCRFKRYPADSNVCSGLGTLDFPVLSDAIAILQEEDYGDEHHSDYRGCGEMWLNLS